MSRTSKSIQNSKAALIYYFWSILLGFISRKVFIDSLGTELLGLNTTAQNILGFLNLAELGIGSAIAFTLYKPLAGADKATVNEIVTVQGWLYRRIAILVIIGALITMFFFPWIFSKMELPLWYAYASFCVFLYSSLMTYFVNYQQIVLSANQEEFVVTYYYHFVLLSQSVLQIIALSCFAYPYIWWLVIQIVGATLAAYNLSRGVRKYHPYLSLQLANGKVLSKKYPQIIRKVKQVFFHRIAGFVLQQTSPLVIYAFTSLSLVAIYANYMLIIKAVTSLFSAVFNNVIAGIGNLVAEGDKKRLLHVFHELFSFRFFCAAVCCYVMYRTTNPFIDLWLGKGLLFSDDTLLILLAIMYINMTRTTVENYIYAYGLFQDIYAPVVEASLNLSLSVCLGYFYGITGVLCGVLISLLCVVMCWKPYFLFKYGLQDNLWKYVGMYAKHLVCLVLAVLLSELLLNNLIFEISNDTWLDWIMHTLFALIVFGLNMCLLMYVFTDGMPLFIKRIVSLKQQ